MYPLQTTVVAVAKKKLGLVAKRKKNLVAKKKLNRAAKRKQSVVKDTTTLLTAAIARTKTTFAERTVIRTHALTTIAMVATKVKAHSLAALMLPVQITTAMAAIHRTNGSVKEITQKRSRYVGSVFILCIHLPYIYSMRQIPILLIYSRLVTSFVLVLLAIFVPGTPMWVYISLLTYGLLSDVFDGIIARRLGVSNEKMRRMDSAIDQVFWLSIIAATYILHPDFYKTYWIELIIILGLEAFTYLVSYIKFRKEVATHAILSKVWVLTIFATLVEVIATGNSHTLFYVCFYTGIVTRVEILVILFLLRQWTNDVPSVYHAVQLRKGKEIKRNGLFNG
jgi:CDP-diacylglycerol--glycerol-3-phosphate 3-phosphatidyltransferase